MDEFEREQAAMNIEGTLIVCFNCVFVHSVVFEDYIHVAVASGRFRNLDVATRTSLIYSTLKRHDAEILEKIPVIVESFTVQEVDDYEQLMSEEY